ncbi:MAG: hypothetical protein IPK31_06485 [Chitinophagaceae bacterium]|nr:hypothetical protein [Chitinophagaceae bacterium]
MQALQPFADKNETLIEVVPTKETIFKLKDKDENSDFYFEVLRQEPSNGNPGYIIEFKPTSKNDTNSHKVWTKLETIISFANTWIQIITEYNSIQTIYDDPVIKQYEEEFYKDFKIVDDDAETSRFNFSQQLLLLSYVENLEKYIAEEEEFTIDDKEELLKEANTLKHKIATESKDSYIKKQSTFWAKVRKKSIKACEFTLKEFAKVVIKNAAEKGLTISWDTVPHYFEQLKNLLN